MSNPTRVIQYGLGPIGSAIARHVTERDGLVLVGAVDVDPAKAGRDAGEVIGLGRELGFPVTATLAETLARTDADAALHATSSYFDRFKPQILELLDAGLDVVSTAEELSFPWLAHPDEAREIDVAAKRAGKTVLGTGVNPGFLMDSLPLFLTAICQRVDHIEVRRAQNASLRRGPFQAKIGAGLTVDEFQARMAAGRMGHVGLPESIGMIFHTLGRTLARYESAVEPVVAQRRVVTEFFDVPPGRVLGLKQTARGFAPEGEFVVLTFLAALDAEENCDTVVIRGVPDLEVTLRGTNGDRATVAIAVNAIRRVREAAPGLATMPDLPLITYG
ncbi:MAG: dihydrodipicolinate reductase [Anaerolineae bacterium]|jgi:4-hydroxy-tetrahydrodipicolinate reductase|nr:dihydrodipicolinate reductase [Anaerolineae bacterium]